ncbi:unknown [Roseburia sp. CAG:182]|nr:unknown [Roseburia sp. CAG:182]
MRAQVVEGVQGRYFIPLLLPLCLVIAGRREDENELLENDRLGLTLALGVNICVLAVLIITFLP